MTFASAERHVYLREIAQGERTSLSVLAGLVTPGARVLDLGTGSGALGQYLRDERGCVVDGVTINEKEAAIARPHYRRIEVADLDNEDWVALFGDERYDFIVCADVLEHLRQPENVLRACRRMLCASGQVLISVPNAAYSGLVAELLEGDFTYRDEGLLDRTHLRFFTRRSLGLFLAEQGWAMKQVEAIERPFTESEFRGAFNLLPPAVSRYLLALPDAETYQLIVAAEPQAATSVSPMSRTFTAPATAAFSVQLYLGDDTGFAEARKVVAAGAMGVERQLLRFDFQPQGVRQLRFDPADRPGFVRLHGMRLTADGLELWRWNADTDGLAVLAAKGHHDIVLRDAWAGMLVLVHGSDPFIDLPVPDAVLDGLHTHREAALEVELGWPMSADYMALAGVVEPLKVQLEAQRASAHETLQRVSGELEAMRDHAREAQNNAREALESARETRAKADLHASESAARLQLLLGQTQVLGEQARAVTDERNMLSRHRLALQTEIATLGQQYAALAEHLRWIESSTVFRASRPLVKAKMKIEQLTGRRARPAVEPTGATARKMTPVATTVDIIVPVYRGLDDTRQCILSVLASTCVTPWRLVILNDASPEPAVTDWLREVSRGDDRILLLENAENLGFVGTVNRGMALDALHDVLLLNSDTEVANDWLDRLRDAAYSDARVASVTPFSNNATICSYPSFCEGNELPPLYDTRRLDALFAATNAGQMVDVPTGVGFCMYIRRDCLREVGLFDVEQFGKGYGEENDFCRRAAAAGWRNLHALDTFVLHTGGVSFGASKSKREQEAVEKLRKLHPSYDGVVHDFVREDPAWTARHAVDLARIRSAGVPCVLAVLHDRAGGTVRQVFELAAHLQGKATFLSLTPAPGNCVWLELVEPRAAFRLQFALPSQWDDLLETLRNAGVAHVHYHHVLGHRPEISKLGELLGVPWDFTAHDYYAMCPQISLTDHTDRYCGETGDGNCNRCGAKDGNEGTRIVEWRAHHGSLLTGSRHVLAPSLDTARRFVRMWGSADIRLAPHTDIASADRLPSPAVAAHPANAPLRVAVIGALSRIKGADLLEDVALLAARNAAAVEFHLVGHAYRQLRTQPKATLTVHGAYAEAELPKLLAWLKPDLIWFPALWPETYSYTLSECLKAGLPIVGPELGAFPERLASRPWSWIVPWDETPQQWLERFEQIRSGNFASGVGPAPAAAFAPGTQDVRIRSWNYDTDYLAGVTAVAVLPSTLPAAFLDAHRPAGGHGGGRQQIKGRALSVLVRLRSAPALRAVARLIPLRWQTRVKSWLRA